MPRTRAVCLALCAMMVPGIAAAQDTADLKRLSIEELMRIDVTTVGRRSEPVGITAAAISVVTSDDIRRAGVTTIPDALRLVPGVHVAQSNGAAWHITTRGFNQVTANKLLVMIDGRTVYSPLFTGVFWNVIDYPLEDIERIEIIRGPGATLWGANAVNGIIHVITKHTRSTRGFYASASAGNEDRGTLTLRHGGGSALDGVAWRVYGTLADHDAQRFAGGLPSHDGRTHGQAGFRLDAGTPERTSLMFKGDAFRSRNDFTNGRSGAFTELDLQASVSHALAPGSQIDVQSYYRREARRQDGQFAHHIDILDLDAQHAVRLRDRHAVVWGGGVRVNDDGSAGTPALSLAPPSRVHGLASVFVQDEIAIRPGRWFITPGAKWEYNSFTGGSLQPSVRTRVMLPGGQVAWGAVSRANRRPSRLEHDLVILGAEGLPTTVGSDAFLPERLLAIEAGYRVQPNAALAVEAAVFRHRFEDLRSVDLPVAVPGPYVLGNSLEGRSQGLELSVSAQPTRWWRLSSGYTWLDTNVRPEPGGRAFGPGTSEANDPHHLFHLRTSFDLPRDVDLDASLRAVGPLSSPAVPGYGALDLRLGWRATGQIEVFAAGRNLLDARHPEFGAPTPSRVEIERAVRFGIIVRR